MRAIIIMDRGEVQIDLVPESEDDKAVLEMIPAGKTLRTGKGSGYAPAAGGYFRPYGDDGSVKFTYLTSIEKPAEVQP